MLQLVCGEIEYSNPRRCRFIFYRFTGSKRLITDLNEAWRSSLPLAAAQYDLRSEDELIRAQIIYNNYKTSSDVQNYRRDGAVVGTSISQSGRFGSILWSSNNKNFKTGVHRFPPQNSAIAAWRTKHKTACT